MITDADMPEGYLLRATTAELLVIVDAEHPDLLLDGELDDRGDLVFSVKAVDSETGRRGTVQGWVLFDLMVCHFGGRMRSITAFWTSETNYEMFRKLLAEGATIHEAASNTWTATQAQRHGFLAVIVIPLTATSPKDSVMVKFIRTRNAP